jgi:predicted nucleic acid-binding protein
MGIDLPYHGTVFIDTAPFIYYFEDHPVYAQLFESLLQEIDEKSIQIITSMITYIEVLTKPKELDHDSLVSQYRNYFTNSENLSLYPVNFFVAEETAFFRAQYKLRTPDAIQFAIAKSCGADCIITNDKGWKGIKTIPVYVLDDFKQQ